MNPAEYMEPARLGRLLLMVVLGMLAIYIEAAPLGLGPTAPPSPDLLMCVLAYWSIRRPEATPVMLVFALGLVRDLLTDVPVGAGALSLVLVTEALKIRRRHLARSSFVVEWVTISIAALAALGLIWLLVVLTFAQPPYIKVLLHQCLYTVMAYPLVVLVFRWGLRIGWTRPEPIR